MINLLLAGLFFAAIHLGISGTALRDRLVGLIGTRGYMIAFSVASLAGLIWLVSAYRAAAYVPTWGQLQWWKPVADVLMIPAFVLVVAGLSTPNPTAVAGERLVDLPPHGIVRVTRHPFLVGVFIWACVHLVGNGDVASLILFGSLAVVAGVGPVSIDAKRRRALGDPTWEGFARKTSIVPFAAILSGRSSFEAGEIGWLRLVAGVLAYVIILGGHVHLFGVSPY